jgi:hypothetical protein
VEVFRRCQQTWVTVGMGGAIAVGLSAQEVAAGERLAGLELAPHEALYVQDMGRVAAEVLNTRKP